MLWAQSSLQVTLRDVMYRTGAATGNAGLNREAKGDYILEWEVEGEVEGEK